MSVSNIALTYFLPFSLAMICFAMGLGLTLKDFKQLYIHPKAAALGIVGQLLLLPALAFIIAYSLALPAELAIGLILVAACPGGAHSNLLTDLAKGDVALSVALTAISGLICIVSIPLYVYFATDWFSDGAKVIDLSFIDTLKQLLMIVIVPLLFGMGLKHRYPKRAPILEKIVKGFAVILLILIVIGAAAKSWQNVMTFAGDIGLAVVVLNVMGMCLGAMLARLLCLPGRQITTLSLEIGVQNTTLAFGLALTVLDNFLMAVPAVVYALWVYVAAFFIIINRRLLAGRLSSPNASV